MRLAPATKIPSSVSVIRILQAIAFFLVMLLVFGNLPPRTQAWLLPLVLIAVFVRAAIKTPPVAIALLLFAAMTVGSWLILIAAPGTMLLARRYQRMRQQIELSPTHIRRTVLLAMAALVAVLPFLDSSAGAWSDSARNRTIPSAAPLIGEQGPGEEGLLQRFARWLGFGDEGANRLGEGEALRPVPPRPTPPDDPFNWWIVVAVVAIVALLVLAWWLWNQRRPRAVSTYGPVAARPLARLEAVGASIGRPRRTHEGAIAYSEALAQQTGDARLAEAGPLVSGEVYESAFADPQRVDANLTGIEVSPPPGPPPPSIGERFDAWLNRLPLTPRGLLIGALGVVFAILAGWLIIPRLGDLDERDRRFGESSQQIEVAPVVTQDSAHL